MVRRRRGLRGPEGVLTIRKEPEGSLGCARVNRETYHVLIMGTLGHRGRKEGPLRLVRGRWEVQGPAALGDGRGPSLFIVGAKGRWRDELFVGR